MVFFPNSITEDEIREKTHLGTPVTMVFTDIVGSTEIKRFLPGSNDQERDSYYEGNILEPHNQIIRECYLNHGGREVKTIGDAFFLVFDDPSNAVLCSAEIQRRLDRNPIYTPKGTLKIRIGIHTGLPFSKEGDYIGTAVDKAARVEGLGEGSQVLISEATWGLVKDQKLKFKFHLHGKFALKGLEGLHSIYEVLWKGKSPLQIVDKMEVEGFLMTMGYDISWPPEEDEEPFLFKASFTRGFGDVDIRWILHPQRHILSKDVERLQDLIMKNPGTKGLLLKKRPIDRKAQDLIEGNPSINVCPLGKFYNQMLKYENYLKDLIEKSKHEIDPYWVDLECSFEGAGRFSVVECVDSWLEDNTKNQLAILGEFGTGKTWFCRYYAARVAKKHLEDPLQQPRIPILISLREYTNIPDLEALITSMLINRFGFKSFSFQTFMHLNRHGQLLLIFDGFDEMEQRVDYNAAVQNYKKILGTAVSGSKVILTSRPMFFANKEKLQTILRVSKKEFALETTSLLAFEEKQIKEGLKKWMGDEWETYWESIRRIQGLEDLASRPVMTQIISEVLPGILKQGKTDQSDLNGAELYRTYIMDKWIIRAAKDTNLLEIRNEIFLFLRDLAWEMFSLPNRTIPQDDFFTRANEEFKSPDLTNELALLFVFDRQTGNYAFPHGSFMEYLVADKVVEGLSRENSQFLFSVRLTDGIAGFLVNILQTRLEIQIGLFKALLMALPGEQIKMVLDLLKKLGEGNPLIPIIKILEKIDYKKEELPQHISEALGQEEFLEQVSKHLKPNSLYQVRNFLLELLSSPNLSTDRVLKELNQIIYYDPDNKIRRHAVQILGKRKGQKEIQALIEAISCQELPVEIREICIDNIMPLSITDGSIRPRALEALHHVINNDQDDIGYRRYCVSQLWKFNSREALEPLLKILKNFGHKLWQVSNSTLARTNLLDLVDYIGEEIISLNEEENSLEHEIAYLRETIDLIKKNSQNKDMT